MQETRGMPIGTTSFIAKEHQDYAIASWPSRTHFIILYGESTVKAGIDGFPVSLPFADAHGLVDGRPIEPLQVATDSTNLQSIDLRECSQAKVLFVGEAPKTASP